MTGAAVRSPLGPSAAWEIRDYRPGDADQCETLTRDAFWDVYRPGCHEHLLWHRLASGHPDVLPGTVLVAEWAGEAVGCILSTRAHVHTPSGRRIPVVAVGPLAVRPDRRRRGIGAALVRATLERAADAGERAAFLYGSPGYYPRFGFVDAARLGVTTAEGDNFADFMGRPLAPHSLDGIAGRLVESEAFAIDQADVDAFDRHFPPRQKARRPPLRTVGGGAPVSHPDAPPR